MSGAGGGSRTLTALRPPVFETGLSTIPAPRQVVKIYLLYQSVASYSRYIFTPFLLSMQWLSMRVWMKLLIKHIKLPSSSPVHQFTSSPVHQFHQLYLKPSIFPHPLLPLASLLVHQLTSLPVDQLTSSPVNQ